MKFLTLRAAKQDAEGKLVVQRYATFEILTVGGQSGVDRVPGVVNGDGVEQNPITANIAGLAKVGAPDGDYDVLKTNPDGSTERETVTWFDERAARDVVVESLGETLAAQADVIEKQSQAQASAIQAAAVARRYTSTTLAQADASLTTGMWFTVPDATYAKLLKVYERTAGGSAQHGVDATSLGYVFVDEATGRTAILGAGGGLGARFLYAGTTGAEIEASISSMSSGGSSTIISVGATAAALANATTGRKTIDATALASPYTLSADDKQYATLVFIGSPVDDPFRIVLGDSNFYIDNQLAASKAILARRDGSDPGVTVKNGSRLVLRVGGDNRLHASAELQLLEDESATRASADAAEIVARKTDDASVKDLLLSGYSTVASRTGTNQHVGKFAIAVGIDCAAAGGDVLPGSDIKRIPIRCKPGTGATKAVIKISSRLTAGGTVDSAPGAAGDVEIISLTKTLVELGLTAGVQSTTNLVLPYAIRTVDGVTYLREMEFRDDAGTRIASDWGAVIQTGLPARKRGYYRETAGAVWSTFDSGSNPTEWQLDQAVYTQNADIAAGFGAINASLAPVNSQLVAEQRASTAHRRYRAPKPGYIESTANLLWDLPLTSSLAANVGSDLLSFTRGGNGAIVDCYGALQITGTNEARFWGARRVSNIIADDTFTAGWTLGPGVTKTRLENVLGPYRQRMNVHRFTRASGSTPFITLNSATYRPGQYTVSIEAAADGVSTYQIRVERTTGSVMIASLSITPPAKGFVRYGLFWTIPDSDQYRIVITAAAGAAPIDLVCAQLERTYNQNGAPNEYVPRGSAWDTPASTPALWHGAGVDGVRYFDYYNPCILSSSGIVTESQTRIEIPSEVRKGLLVGPTRVNKFYESRDIGAGSWTLSNATAVGAMINSGLLGPSSLRKLEETTDNGQHRVSQSWKGTLPANNVMITIAAFVPLTVVDRSILVIGFYDKAGAEKKAIVNIATRTVVSETGNIFKTHITQIGDLLRIGFTDTSGTGSAAPIGFFGLATLVSGAPTESYAGTVGNGIYLGGVQFERTDHPCIYLGDTGTTTPSGTADDLNAPVFPTAMGNYDWNVSCEATPMYDSDSQCKSSWSYVWYATVASNIRWGCGIRPGAFGGAIVEDYVKNPVFDVYAGPDGTGVPQTPYEVFDVANVLHVTPALQTVLWQIALHPTAVDGSSNIAMYVGAKPGVLDSNGTHIVSKVPLGAPFKIGYKGTPIDEKCVKNFKVFSRASTVAQMSAAVQ